MPLADEEGEFPEDGTYGEKGAYSASIGPTLCCCVVYHRVDVGEWYHAWIQKVELCQKGG